MNNSEKVYRLNSSVVAREEETAAERSRGRSVVSEGAVKEGAECMCGERVLVLRQQDGGRDAGWWARCRPPVEAA
jgi:hypothetical protein